MKKQILNYSIVLAICMFSIHFLWIYCLPVSASNHSMSDLYSIKPDMTPSQVIEIIGKPLLMKVYTENKKCGKISKYYDDFKNITKNYKKSTWIFSNQDYFKKTLEIYVNFSNGKVTRIAVEDNDLALYLYESGASKPLINKKEKLLLYLRV